MVMEMATADGLGEAREEYMALVRAFPLMHIRDAAHLTAALAEVDRLTDKGPLSPAEDAYLLALSDLVEVYEDATVRIPPVAGIRMVRHFMDDRALKQKDLVGPVFGAQSIASEVLSGERPLALSHIKALAAYFHVSPAVFID